MMRKNKTAFRARLDTIIKDALSSIVAIKLATTEYKLRVCQFTRVHISECASCYLTKAPPAQVAEGEDQHRCKLEWMQQQHAPWARQPCHALHKLHGSTARQLGWQWWLGKNRQTMWAGIKGER